MKRLLILSFMLTSGLMQAAHVAPASFYSVQRTADNGANWIVVGSYEGNDRVRVITNDARGTVYDSATIQAAGTVVPGQPGWFSRSCSNAWQGFKNYGKGLAIGTGVTGAAALVIACAKASHSYAAEAQHQAQLMSIKDHIMASGEKYGHLAVEGVKKFAEEIPTFVEKIEEAGSSYAPELLKPAIEVPGEAVQEMGKTIATNIIANIFPRSERVANDAATGMTGGLFNRVGKEISFGALSAGIGVALSNLREFYGSTSKAYICGLLTAPVAAIAYGVTHFNR